MTNVINLHRKCSFEKSNIMMLIHTLFHSNHQMGGGEVGTMKDHED